MSDYPHIPFPQPALSFRQRPKQKQESDDHDHDHDRKRRRKPTRWKSWLYHATFGFWIALIIVLLGGSAWGLSEQAIRGGPTRWNIFLILAAYVALLLISIAHLVSRRLSIKRIMKTIPKPYVPTKAIDLPHVVADHIMVEYSRTAVIAHISQATKGMQEGWGRPGTKWENQHFRTCILSTVSKIQKAIPIPYPNPSPTSLEPYIRAIQEDKALALFMVSYEKIVENARYGRREPTEADATACEKVVDLIILTMELKRKREKSLVPQSPQETLLTPFGVH